MKWFSNLSTRTKILGSFGVLCLLLVGLGFNSMRDLRAVEENLRVVYADYTVPASELGHLATDTGEYANNTLAIVNATTVEFVEEHVKEQSELRKDVNRILDAYGATVLRVSRSGKSETTALEAARKSLNAYFDASEATAKAKLEALQINDPAARAKATEEILGRATGPDHQKFEQIGVDVQAMLETVAAVASDMNDDGKATVASGVRANIVGTIIAVFVALVSGLIIAARIAEPLKSAVGVLESVAGGDFTAKLEVDSKDEVGAMAQMLNAAVSGMNSALLEVRRTADQVAGAAGQLSAASQSISSGAQEQASSLEETAASLEQMTGTVKQNSDNSQQASSLAQGARDVADEGGKVVGQAVVAMGEINQSSKKIADIITTIDEIAFQTNLLALNAAVEAARAGEQGRGFAVVAAEVRTLAQRSAGAAKEIKTLIQDSVRKVEAGSTLVGKSGESLKEIVSSVKRVSDIVAEIAAATKEQSTGIEQVNTAVTQMDSVTQSNASQTEELSGTAETLAAQAKALQDLVARFHLADGGDRVVSVRAHREATASAAAAPKAKAVGRRAEGKRVVSAPVSEDQLQDVSLDDIQPAAVSSAAPSPDKGFEEF